MSKEADDIFEKIKQLNPPDQLRLAAELLECGRAAMAHTIADKVVVELGAALAIAMVPR